MNEDKERLKALREDRKELLGDLAFEWRADENGNPPPPGMLDTLVTTPVDETAEPAGGWESYLTIAGRDMFQKLCATDCLIRRLDMRIEGDEIAAAMKSYLGRP